MSNDEKKKNKKDEEKDFLNDLFNLKIFGVSLGDFLKDVDETREKLLEHREELQKKYGNKVKIDFGVKISGLGERRVISSGKLWDDLVKERSEWKKQMPTMKITKEDIKKTLEELDKEKAAEKKGVPDRKSDSTES